MNIITRENFNSHLKVNKRTGEVKTCLSPHYQGTCLSDVYGRYSEAKRSAYEMCYNLLETFAEDGTIVSYGITSHNVFNFTFAGVFTDGVEEYVMWCKSTHDNYDHYGNSYVDFNYEIYLLED